MNKSDLINEVGKVVKNRDDAHAVVNCVLSTIVKALKKDNKVMLSGFGTFKVVKKKERRGRNPRTGEMISIKANEVPRFIPSRSLKDALK
jgi:DNA-binding protein HU-beta